MAAEKLTKNQDLVYKALLSASSAMSAYDLLDQLRPNGVRAPIQIYRALDGLHEHGLIHRIERLNAYVACAHDHEADHDHQPLDTAFAVCSTCGDVAEFSAPGVREALGAWADAAHFQARRSTIEIEGKCVNCLDEPKE